MGSLACLAAVVAHCIATDPGGLDTFALSRASHETGV